jgi:hypothetical protein
MSNNQKLIEVAEEIDKLKNKKAKQQKEIKRLENENNTKQELYTRNEEKIAALKIELEERKRELKYLEDPPKDGHTVRPSIAGKDQSALFTEDIFDKLNDLTFLEKFNKLLEEKIHHMDNNFKDELKKMDDNDEVDDPERDFYAKAVIKTITIRYMHNAKKYLEDEEKNKKKRNIKRELEMERSINYIGLRLAGSTKFSDFMDIACRFWNVDPKTHELTDESFSQLPHEEYVETFFKTRHQESSPILLILKERDMNCQLLNPAMQDAISLQENSKKKVDEVNLAREIKQEIDKYQEFFRKFPGMKFYIDSDKIKEKERGVPKKAASGAVGENHCCVFLMMLLLLSFTCTTLFNEVEVFRNYYTAASIQNLYGVNNELLSVTESSGTGIAYDQILNVTAMWTYFSNRIAPTYFLSTGTVSQTTFQYNNAVVGPLRFRTMRVNSKSCQHMAGAPYQVGCYYDEYTSSTKATSTILDGSQPWMYYQTPQQSLESGTITGYYGTYDGSGYIVDIDPAYSTRQDFLNMITNDLMPNHFVNISTRALAFTVNMYNIPGDYYLTVQMLLEFDVVGGVYINPLTVQQLQINLYDSPKANHSGFDAVKGILAAFLFVFILNILFRSPGTRFNFSYLFTSYGFINTMIAVLTFVAIAKTHQLNSLGLQPTLINANYFVELGPAAILYQSIFFYQSIACGLLIFRLVYFLKMNAEFEIIFMTLEKTGKMILTYCGLVIPIIFAFAISGMILWASLSSSFVTLDQAFLSCILLALGRFDRQILIDAEYIPTIIYLTIYYLFVIFFLITVLVGLYVDNYRITMMDYGYNYARFGEKKTVKDLFRWLFEWLPREVWNKLDGEDSGQKAEDKSKENDKKLDGKKGKKQKKSRDDQSSPVKNEGVATSTKTIDVPITIEMTPNKEKE